MHHSQNGVQRNAQRSELPYTQDTCQDRWAQTLTTPSVHERDTTTVRQMPQGLLSTMHAIVFALHYHGTKRMLHECIVISASKLQPDMMMLDREHCTGSQQPFQTCYETSAHTMASEDYTSCLSTREILTAHKVRNNLL